MNSAADEIMTDLRLRRSKVCAKCGELFQQPHTGTTTCYECRHPEKAPPPPPPTEQEDADAAWERDHPRVSHCGLCDERGHNRTKCPNVCTMEICSVSPDPHKRGPGCPGYRP